MVSRRNPSLFPGNLDQDEVYLFSMSGVVRKYEILQVGDRVRFQVGLDGQTTLRRAVNIIRTVYVLQVKTLRSDGEVNNSLFAPIKFRQNYNSRNVPEQLNSILIIATTIKLNWIVK